MFACIMLKKVKNLFFIIVVILIVFPQIGKAQTKKTIKLKEDADEYYVDEYYEEALEMYQSLDTLIPDNPEIKFKLGVCYYYSPFESKSLPYFQIAEKLGYKDDYLDYYYGRADHLNHMFDDAKKHYQLFLERFKDSTGIPQYAKVEKYMKQCDVGKKLYADSLSIEIQNLGPQINTKYPEYVPLISADESVLIFTSRRPSTTGGKISIDDEQYFEDIYVSYRQESGGWSAPKSISENINTKKHDACIGLSPDGQKLFIYKARRNLGKIAGDIYVSHLDGEEWQEPIKLGENINTAFGWEPSASISADGKTLYFVSDRPGGYGGTDIYVSTLNSDGEWGEAQNMGETINTPDNDDAPFIHVDGKTLYFSSEGHEGIGGYDIFITVKDEKSGVWGKPINAGYPINTADHDVFFVWSADGTKGYFSSYREDTYGEKDLYVATRPTEGANLVVFKGHITDAETELPVLATIKITDLETNKLIGVYNSNSVHGKYSIILPHGKNYNVTVEADGYLFQSLNVNVPSHTHYFEVHKDIQLDPVYETPDTTVSDTTIVASNDTLGTDPVVHTGSKMVLNNIFFDFDKATLRQESYVELKNIYKMMSDYPEMIVEISGHTDNKGDNKYNQILSEKRALAVVSYLVNKGVSKDRVVAIGYGKEKPQNDNSNDSLRQLNRRTELKLIKKSERGDYSKRVINLNRHGLKKISPTRVVQQEYRYTSKELKPEMGDLLNLKVHFLFDDHEHISEFSKGRLAKLISLLEKYPELKLRLHAHADPMGTDIYNQALSEKRAERVKTYLVEKGINGDRLEVSTYGEELPLVKSEDVAENLRNRRVEFEVIK